MQDIFKRLKTESHLIFFVISLIVGLIPLLWFKGLPIAGEEYYALNYAQWGNRFSNSWFDSVNWGEYSPLSSFKFQGLIFSFMYFLGFSHYLALLFWYVSISVLTIGIFYIFLYELFGKKYPAFLYFVASAYYLFSPFFLNISVTLSPPKLFFLFLPLIFILFIKWTKKGGIKFNDLVVVNLILLFASPVFVNIPLGLVLLGITLLNILAVLMICRVKWFQYVRSLAIFISIYLIFNVWWLVPTITKQLSQSADVRQEAASFVTVDKTATLDVLSLFGSWAFREKIFNTDYYYFPFNKIYDNFPGAIIRFIPYSLTILAIYAFYKSLFADKNHKKEKNPVLYYLLLIHVIFLFLSKGTSEPLSFIYKLLYEKFPFFWMYREPYAKFAPVASFTTSVLMVFGTGYLYNELYKKLPKSYSRVTAVIASLALVYYAQPFLNGTVIWDVNHYTTRSYHVKVPDNWTQITQNWKHDNGYYYQFPSTDIYDSYNWESGYNGNPYLMLTDAKLLNPERGYSASENVERKYVTSYLYDLIINNREQLIEVASRYYLSGILLQKDTVYNNYKYAFKVIQEKYQDLVGFNNDAVSIYNLQTKEPSLIDIVSQESVLNLDSATLPYYHLVRQVSNVSNLINISQDKTDYKGLSPQGDANNNNSVIFTVPNESQGSNFYLYGNLENIISLGLDDKTYPIKNTEVPFLTVSPSVNPGCCKKITVNTKDGIVSGGSAPLIWGSVPIFTPDLTQYQRVDSGLLNISTDTVFVAQIPFFDPKLVNHIQFALKGNYNYPVGVSLVQVDSDTLSTRYFANYKVQDISKPLNIVYDGVVNPLTNIFNNPKYYIAVYGMKLTDADQKPVEYPKDLFYTGKVITVIQERIPYIFTLPEAATKSSEVITPEYKQINSSLTIVKTPSEMAENSLLHFKNSFNKNWVMLNISEDKYNKINTSGIQITDLVNLYFNRENGKLPVNIEYYSNGWILNKSDSGNYFAIVFIPSLVQEICFVVTKVALLCLGLLYLTIRIKKFFGRI